MRNTCIYQITFLCCSNSWSASSFSFLYCSSKPWSLWNKVKYLKIKTAYAFLESNKSDVIRIYIRHNYTNNVNDIIIYLASISLRKSMPWDSNNSNCAKVQSTGSAIKREHTLLLTHARINFHLNKRKLLVWYYPKQSLLGS